MAVDLEISLLRLHALASKRHDTGATGISRTALDLVTPQTIKESDLADASKERLLIGLRRDNGRMSAGVRVTPNWQEGHAQFATVSLASSPNDDGLELLHRFAINGHPVTTVTPSLGFVGTSEYKKMRNRSEGRHLKDADALIKIVAQAFGITEW